MVKRGLISVSFNSVAFEKTQNLEAEVALPPSEPLSPTASRKGA
jgi:hypothetical protein